MTDLESQLAFQEATIDELNQLVTSQNQELALFKRQLQTLAGRLNQLKDQQQGNDEPVDERPPHY